MKDKTIMYHGCCSRCETNDSQRPMCMQSSCPCHSPTEAKGGWEDFETFDSFFAGLSMKDEKNAIKLYEKHIANHIRQTLSSQRAELLQEVEGLRVENEKLKLPTERNGFIQMGVIAGTNKAIDQVIKIIKDKE